jgi:hypothetical protein
MIRSGWLVVDWNQKNLARVAKNVTCTSMCNPPDAIMWIFGSMDSFEIPFFESEILGGVFKYSLIGIEELQCVLIQRYEIQHVLVVWCVRAISTTDYETSALRLLRKWFCWWMISWNYCRTYCYFVQFRLCCSKIIQMGKQVTSFVVVIVTWKHDACSFTSLLWTLQAHGLSFTEGLTASGESVEHG